MRFSHYAHCRSLHITGRYLASVLRACVPICPANAPQTSDTLGTLYEIMEEEHLVVKKIYVNVISLKRQKDWR